MNGKTCFFSYSYLDDSLIPFCALTVVNTRIASFWKMNLSSSNQTVGGVCDKIFITTRPVLDKRLPRVSKLQFLPIIV